MADSEVKKLGIEDKSEPHEMTAMMADNLRVFAGQKWPTMNHKWRKAKLASMLRMSDRRIKSIYEADPAARIRADEADQASHQPGGSRCGSCGSYC